MRVAMLAPIAWRVPPRHYGPWERVVSLLTEGLVARGIDVTLFASADSETSARLAAICPRPYAEDLTLNAKVWECLHIGSLFERAAEFDVIHNHFDFLPLTYGALVATPLITTIHGFSSPDILSVYQRYNRHGHYIAISDANRHPSLDYLATVYHGIALDELTLRMVPDEYLLFFGRIHPDKGVAEAIEVAHRAGRRLVIAGIIQDTAYFDQQIVPHIDGNNVCYVGSVGPNERDSLLGGAAALLHLIRFEEPFGLSMVEAMACGTPVIAYGRGSVPEIVRHGESGWIVDGLRAAVAAVSAIETLDRRQIRAYVARRFSRDMMVDAYLRLYHDVCHAQASVAGAAPHAHHA
jgi:glycosyltransferase involved in cell wall biosynthesis